MLKSNTKLKLAIFHNLPSGGGHRVFSKIESIIKNNPNIIISVYNSPQSNPRNFLDYLFYIYFKLPKIHKKIADDIDFKNYDWVLVGHDYWTKSPYLLKFLKSNSAYFCMEEPREFYQDQKYLNTTIKSKIINLLRYPLKYIDKKNIKYSNLLFTNSKFSQKKLKSIYNLDFKIFKMGVDLDLFRKNRTYKKKYYLTIGSTSKFKGIDFLIESIAKLPVKYRYPLYIVGDRGRDHKYISNLAKHKGFHLKFYTNIKDSKLVKLYNQAQLLLAGAIREPFGLSILEAFACGTNVVAVNDGGYREIIEELKTGFLSERNVDDFSTTIQKALHSKLNASEIRKKINRQFSWVKSTNDLIHILQRKPLR